MPTSPILLREVRRFIEAARPSDDSDRALLARFIQTRDEHAFAELVSRHGPMVLGVCRRTLRQGADAEDALQATFLILVRKASEIRDPDRLGPWLYGVALRTANRLRMSRRPVVPLPDDLAQPTCDSDWPVELDEAIYRLPEKYRTPIILYHLQGLSATEVAIRLGCPPATIVTRLFRARATLRRRLTALGITVPAALVGGSVLQIPTATASAIAEMAAGRTISPAAARLADGVFRSILMTKIRWAATTVAAFSLLGVGVLGFQVGGQEKADQPKSELIPPAIPPTALAEEKSSPTQQGVVTTANFLVTAPSNRVAKLVAEAAERTRKEAAMSWLGKELPGWNKPCPIRVTIGKNSGGATTFEFADGKRSPEMSMIVEGELDRLLTDTVPHEVTHCVLADHFRSPVPRWADEGICLLSESEEEHAKHRNLAREAVRKGDFLQMRALLESKEYPRNVASFYAQGWAVTKMLVEKRDRPTLIAFVKNGLKNGWESAAKTDYGYASLAELEAAVLRSISDVPVLTPSETLPSPTILATASSDAEGRVSIHLLDQVNVPSTHYAKREKREIKDGQPVVTQSYEPVILYTLLPKGECLKTFAKSEVKAFSPDGKAIDEKKMLGTLKGSARPVVVTTNPKGIDPAFASLIKQDGMILVVPALNHEPPATPTAR